MSQEGGHTPKHREATEQMTAPYLIMPCTLWRPAMSGGGTLQLGRVSKPKQM